MAIARELHKFPHEVDGMPAVDAFDLGRDLGVSPPVHLIARAMAGIKPPEDDDGEPDIQALREMLG